MPHYISALLLDLCFNDLKFKVLDDLYVSGKDLFCSKQLYQVFLQCDGGREDNNLCTGGYEITAHRKLKLLLHLTLCNYQ